MYLPLKYLTNCNGPQKCQRCCCWCCKVQELPEIQHKHTSVSVYLELQFQLQSQATLHAVSTNFTLFWLSWLWWWGIKMRSRHRSRQRLEIFIGMPCAAMRYIYYCIFMTQILQTALPFLSPIPSLSVYLANCRSEQSCQFLGGRYSGSRCPSFAKNNTRLKTYLF